MRTARLNWTGNLEVSTISELGNTLGISKINGVFQRSTIVCRMGCLEHYCLGDSSFRCLDRINFVNRNPHDGEVTILIERWQSLRDQGIEVSVERLCRDSPHLIESLKRELQAIEKMDALMEESYP